MERRCSAQRRSKSPIGSPELPRRRFNKKPALGNRELRAVILINFVNFVDSLGGNISTPILPFYAEKFHATYAEIGVLFSAFALAQLVAMPALGYLSDRYGRRMVLLASIFGTMLGALWQGIATNYTSLLCARIFSGFWSGVSSVCQIYLVDVVPPEHRAQYLGYYLSSTQASILFGPSLGAGLSVLGLNMPLLIQAAVCAVLFPVVWFHLAESPEWLRLHSPAQMSPMSPNPQRPLSARADHSPNRDITLLTSPGIGPNNTRRIIASFGLLSLCGMVTQMSVVSMFAVYAKQTFDLDSLHVGFIMTLGAVASIATNIWISPMIQEQVGQISASILGFAVMVMGTLGTVMRPLELSIAGIMFTYLGLAINSSAVATGAANLTDANNRATVMTGVRMFKSLGAVTGPIIAGKLAGVDIRLPFLGVGAGFALVGTIIQLAAIPLIRNIQNLLSHRQTVGKATGLLEGVWQDEYGTPEEIRDLGEYVANLLTTRHYRWVTYNDALKNFLSDAFPPIPYESEELHREVYDQRRRLVKELNLDAGEMSYAELRRRYEELCEENAELRANLEQDDDEDDDQPSRTASFFCAQMTNH